MSTQEKNVNVNPDVEELSEEKPPNFSLDNFMIFMYQSALCLRFKGCLSS